MSSAFGIGTAWPTSQRSAWVRNVLILMSVIFTSIASAFSFVGVAAAYAVKQNRREQQQPNDDVGVIRTDCLHIEDVGRSGDDQQAERGAKRVSDTATQDRVAADHHRGVHLKLEAGAGVV